MNLAVISTWHVHTWDYVSQIRERSDCTITAVWDIDKGVGEKLAADLNCRYFDDYDALLADPTIEGVIIVSPTNMHKELIIKAANAKKHIFTEKVLAFTKADALEIKKAVEENGVRFAISLPFKSRGDVRLAKQMFDEGAFGTVTYMRVRNAHDGSCAGWLPPHFYDKELCGGGAMMDLGAHPMYLLGWFLGVPDSMHSTFTTVTNKAVDENAVSVFSYKDGTIAVSETGFVSANNPLTIEITGTKGSLMLHNGLYYATEATDNLWVKAESIPDDLPLPIYLWLDNSPLAYGMDDAVMLSTLMEMAYKNVDGNLPE